MPRPATISTSVATIGCMPSHATDIPFHMPARMEMSNAMAMPVPGDIPMPLSDVGIAALAAIAPARAMIAPTERSTPPVARTNVIPTDSTITGAPYRKISTSVPVNRPCTIETLKKPRMQIPSMASRIAKARAGQRSLPHRCSRPKAGAVAAYSSVFCSLIARPPPADPERWSA